MASHISDEDYDENWRVSPDINREKLQRTINHVHLDDIFDDVTHQIEFGRALEPIWLRKLTVEFPAKEFAVSVAETSDGSWLIELYQPE